MRFFRIKSSGNVVSEQEYRRMFKNTIFCEGFTPSDADIIQECEKPYMQAAQQCIHDGVEFVGDVWKMKWKVIDVIPQSVSMWKFRAALELNDMYLQVENFINESDDRVFKIVSTSKLNFADVIHRNDPIFSVMIRAGKLTNDKIDEIFLHAFRIV